MSDRIIEHDVFESGDFLGDWANLLIDDDEVSIDQIEAGYLRRLSCWEKTKRIQMPK